jgi:hypothetical protein
MPDNRRGAAAATAAAATAAATAVPPIHFQPRRGITPAVHAKYRCAGGVAREKVRVRDVHKQAGAVGRQPLQRDDVNSGGCGGCRGGRLRSVVSERLTGSEHVREVDRTGATCGLQRPHKHMFAEQRGDHGL